MDPGPGHESGPEDWQCPLLRHCGQCSRQGEWVGAAGGHSWGCLGVLSPSFHLAACPLDWMGEETLMPHTGVCALGGGAA